MNKRLVYRLLGIVLLAAPIAACNDNAEDHSEEAREEAASGDQSQAAEETREMNDDLEEGDTTELRN